MVEIFLYFGVNLGMKWFEFVQSGASQQIRDKQTRPKRSFIETPLHSVWLSQGCFVICCLFLFLLSKIP